jgi:hypothetical protein
VLIVLRATNILPIMLQKGVSRDSEDESDNGGQSDVSFFSFCIDGFKPMLLQTSIGLTKVDFELARLCGLLEKKYSNNHNAGYI